MKLLLGILIALGISIVGGAVLVIERPDLVLTPRNLNWLAAQARKKKVIDLSWDSVEVHAKTPHFFGPEISLAWKNLRYQSSSEGSEMKIGLASASFYARLNFLRFPPRVLVLGPTGIEGARVEVRSDSTKGGKKVTQKSKPFQIPEFLSQTEILPISIQIDHWEFQSDGKKFEGKLSLESRNIASHTNWKVSAVENHYGQMDLQAMTPFQELRGPFQIDAHVESRPGVFLPKPVSLNFSARANEDLTLIHADLKGALPELAPHVEKVEFTHCQIDFSRPAADSEKAELSLNCPISVSAETMKLKQYPEVFFENKAGLLLHAQLTSDHYKDMEQPVKGDLAVFLGDYRPVGSERGFKTWGNVRITGSGSPAQPAQNWKFKSNVDMKLAISGFQDLVKVLDKTPYAVPAPFHVLKGGIELSLQGDLKPSGGSLSLRFHTSLKSPHQSLDIDNQGVIRFSRRPQADHAVKTDLALEMDTVLSDIQLTLPHIDLKGIPAVMPDSRIHRLTEKVAAKSSVNFSYNVHVHTERLPVQIVTNLASAPIPIHVDLSLHSEKDPLGRIVVDRFPVDVFHRKATIEKFELDLQEKKKMPISGLVEVDNPQYTVHVAIKGTLEQPIFQFTSEPALEQQDVISVLLFGKTSSDLDTDQDDSVGSTRTAVADRTLGLASLYLLSATPIQSVGYDPTTGAVSTTVTLAQGTSLNIAAAQSQVQTVGIRKRLGHNFSITTELTNMGLDQTGSLAGSSTLNNQKAVAAVIEWRHRY